MGEEIYCSLGNALCSGLALGMDCLWGVMDSCAEHSAGEEFRVMGPTVRSNPKLPV